MGDDVDQPPQANWAMDLPCWAVMADQGGGDAVLVDLEDAAAEDRHLAAVQLTVCKLSPCTSGETVYPRLTQHQGLLNVMSLRTSRMPKVCWAR